MDNQKDSEINVRRVINLVIKIAANKIYNIKIGTKMGYNSKCNYQNCTQGCCNTYGNCPTTTSYSSSLSSKCKYYYSNSTSSQPLEGGAIAGVVVGPIVAVVIIIIIIVCCVKKCREKALAQSNANQQVVQNKNINVTTQQLTTEYNDPNQIIMQNQQPFGQPYYGQPIMQTPMMQPPMMQNPMMQQPVYGSPEQALFGQPIGFEQPPVYPPMQPNYGPSPIIR